MGFAERLCRGRIQLGAAHRSVSGCVRGSTAVRWLRTVVTTSIPNPGDVARELNERGREAAEAGRREEAIRAYEEAAAADPSSATPLYNLGLLHKNRSISCWNPESGTADDANVATSVVSDTFIVRRRQVLVAVLTALGQRWRWRACSCTRGDAADPLPPRLHMESGPSRNQFAFPRKQGNPRGQ